MASRRRDYGSLSPRLQELSAKTTPIEPYPVTDTITIEPPGKKRRDELNEAFAQIMVCSAKTNALLRRSDPEPTPPISPDVPAADATEDQIADYERLSARYAEQVVAFEAEQRAWNARIDDFENQSKQLAADSKQAAEQYNRALFGPAYDDIMALSENWPPELWDAFSDDVNNHFRRGVNEPPDGKCQTCGVVVDEEEAGKAPSSST